MDIPQEKLDEFKRIFKEDYGEDLTNEEAYRIASKLITLFKVIYRPIPEPGERINDYNV